MIFIYFLLLIYSVIVTPDIFFRIFKFKDSDLYTFLYLVFCIVMAITLIGIVLDVYFFILDKHKPLK